MKFVLVSLMLAFGTLQTVSFVQCCCGPLCSTPGEVCKDHDHQSDQKQCTSCDGHSNSSSENPSTDENGKSESCTHLSPTTELNHAPVNYVVHAPQVELLLVDLPPLFPKADAVLALKETVPRATPTRPLYLLASALLI